MHAATLLSELLTERCEIIADVYLRLAFLIIVL